MSQMILIKAGTTFPNAAREYGDFDTWTCRGLGLSLDQVRVFDVSRDSELPAPEQCSGVVITGSHAMVTDEADWSERLVEWIAHLLEARVPFLGICYGHQLLAKAAGGTIGNHPDGPEIGTVAIAPRLCNRMRSVLRNRRARERINIRDCSPEGQRCALLA